MKYLLEPYSDSNADLCRPITESLMMHIRRVQGHLQRTTAWGVQPLSMSPEPVPPSVRSSIYS